MSRSSLVPESDTTDLQTLFHHLQFLYLCLFDIIINNKHLFIQRNSFLKEWIIFLYFLLKYWGKLEFSVNPRNPFVSRKKNTFLVRYLITLLTNNFLVFIIRSTCAIKINICGIFDYLKIRTRCPCVPKYSIISV